MEKKVVAGPETGGSREALGRLEEKKLKLAEKLEDRKSKLGDCPNIFAANFKAARGVAAKGWESSSQSQEEADAGKKQQQEQEVRMMKPGAEKKEAKKVRRNLFGKQQSFQNARVQQEMQQKKRALGDHQRKGNEFKNTLKEGSKKSLKDVKDASPSKLERSRPKPEDEPAVLVFPASPSHSVRQSQVSSWVQTAQKALPSLAPSKVSPQNKALRLRSPRRREKSYERKHQEGSKWGFYQRARAGRRQQGASGKEGRRSRCSFRERRMQPEKPFDLFKEQNQCSFFDSIETNKGKGEGPLDFLNAVGDNNEEPQVKFCFVFFWLFS